MSSYYDDNNIKCIWCRSYYGMELNKQGYKILEIYPCKFNEKCKGAHSYDEIVEKHSIKKWKLSDKSHINILELKDRVIEILEKNKEMIQNIKYRTKIMNLHTLRIDELFAFWYELFYYHHRISKELPTKKAWTNTKSKPAPIEGFNYKDDVPNFYIENDDLWAIERMMHLCPKFMSLDKTIRVSVKNICVGDINCKEGAHDINDLICIDNLITGNCNCEKLDIFNNRKQKLMDEINNINSHLNSETDEGFIINMTKKKKEEFIITIKRIINIKKQEHDNIKRMVHLTEKGFIPLNVLSETKKINNPKPSDEPQVKKTNKIIRPKF
jgi:hypothetical protein